MRLWGSGAAGLLVALWIGTCGALAQQTVQPAPEDHAIIVSAGSRSISGSRFAHLGEFQRGLNKAIVACGLDKRLTNPIRLLDDDGVFGIGSRAAVRAVRACPDHAVPGEPVDDSITVALWNRVVPDFEPPDAVDRAFMLRLTHEGTDFQHFEWNFTSLDSTAFGTWGPDGATFGQSGEIQQILIAAEAATPRIIDTAFAEAEKEPRSRRRAMTNSQKTRCQGYAPVDPAATNASVLKGVLPLRREAAAAVLLPMFCDDARGGVWEYAFSVLGANPAVGKAYFDLYDKTLATCARRGYAAWPSGVKPTEIDFALILDGCVQLTKRSSESQQRDAFSAASVEGLATPAGRRLVIARKLTAGAPSVNGDPTNCATKFKQLPDNQHIFCDRLGRDMAYVRDLADITVNEQSAWDQRTHRVAADVGLTDRELPLPSHFMPILRSRTPSTR